MRQTLQNTVAIQVLPAKKVMTKQEIVSKYGSDCNGNPSIYCGTYGKYNDGSIYGAWLDLTKFSDYDEFIDVCKQLHSDEHDPEFMFQDFECYPIFWYRESYMSRELFDKIIAFANLDDDDREAYEDYIEFTRNDDIDSFRDANMGKWDSEEDFAEHIINECYNLDNMMGNLSSYFDYKKFANDLFLTDYYYANHGYVFQYQ